MVKWKLAAVTGAVALGLAGAGENPPAAPAPAPAGRPPAPAGEGRLVVWHGDSPAVFTPAGELVRRVPTGGGPANKFPGARVSPDGTRVAYKLAAPGKGSARVVVQGVDAPAGTEVGARGDLFFWSADGAKLYGWGEVAGREGDGRPTNWVADVATGAVAAVPLPGPAECLYLLDQAADGRFLAARFDPATEREDGYVVSADLRTRTLLHTGADPFVGLQFSPDGAKVVGVVRPGRGWAVDCRVAVLDVATGRLTQLPLPQPGAYIDSACWSPDGRRVAYSWYDLKWMFPREVEARYPMAAAAVKAVAPPEALFHVSVAAADGSDPKPAVSAGGAYIGWVSWR